jgi:H+-translocating NAD(P) transhydrogenase subunit alpha
MLHTFIPKESAPHETRVAVTPETVEKLVKSQLRVTMEAGAGAASFFTDDLYAKAGATLAADAKEAWASADLVLKVAPLSPTEAERLKNGATVIGFCAPHRNLETVRKLADRKVSALAMELLPRTTKAQPMDALSSQANLAGYKAALLAATRLPRFFPLLMTAAGTIRPAKVLVIGAGVAGLQALATAKRLGAKLEACDVRPAVAEEVASIGGQFFALPMPTAASGAGSGEYAREAAADILKQQHEVLTPRVAAADAVITTAQVPGKSAPKLITTAMVNGMKAGSVIIDIAAEEGGNCELTQSNQAVLHQGVLILGQPNLPATMPQDASTLYARNVLALVKHLLHGEQLLLDTNDEIIGPTLLTHQGMVRHAPTAGLLAKQG